MCAWPDWLPAIVQLELVLLALYFDQLVEARSDLFKQLMIRARVYRSRSLRSQLAPLDLLELHASPPSRTQEGAIGMPEIM
jgi:hypothetical protein